jgi:long-chain acyl-CoA synthetase
MPNVFESRPWLASYPAGIGPEIDTNEYPTLLSLMDTSIQKFGGLPAFTQMGKQLSYQDLDKYATQLAGFLLSQGLQPTDKVAVMMPNLLQYPIAVLACLKAGLVVVNTNPLYTPREMKHQFIDAGAKAIIICENFAANLQQIIGDTPIKTVITASIGEMLGFPKSLITNFVVRHSKKLVPAFNIPNAITFSQALSRGKGKNITPYKGAPNDVVVLQYTGGTTGVSKGAMLTNRNLVANMLQSKVFIAGALKDGQENFLCALPLYHIFAFTVNGLLGMSMGANNILVTNARDIAGVLKEFKNAKISVVTGVNTLFNAMINHADFKNLDFSRLVYSGGGGMAVQRAVAEKWKAITGCTLAEGYGLSECSPVVTTNPLNNIRVGTIGIPLASTDVIIKKEDGTIAGINESGELCVKGPQVMKGYYNRPEATADMMKDGWLHTGDISLMEADGYFKIVDRKKDMILVSGFNVFPNEVEDVVAMHPKVMEVAAIGVPDEKSGEAVKVFVVAKDPTLTAEELIAHCRENLTGYKIPKFVEFRTDLPKTNVGKILRRMLRDEKKA